MSVGKPLKQRLDRMSALLAAEETYHKERIESYRRRAHAAAEKRSQEFAASFASERNVRVKRLTEEREKLAAALTALGETDAVAVASA